MALTAVAEDAKPTTVLGGIVNPCGIAVQAATGHVFIAAHSGVHRFDPKSGKAHVEISGFPTDIYGKGPKYNIGPLGLAFWDDEHLIVGDGSRPDGDELVRIFKVGKDAPHADHPPIKEDAAIATLGPIKASEETAKGEGNFYGVASNGKSIFITCNGDDPKGWIAKSTAAANGKPGAMTLSIATPLPPLLVQSLESKRKTNVTSIPLKPVMSSSIGFQAPSLSFTPTKVATFGVPIGRNCRTSAVRMS